MATQEADPDSAFPGKSVLETILGATSLKIAVIGVLFWLVAILLQAGVWAALMAIWGTALIVVGLAIYTIVWWTYQ